ncbi:MAG: nitroreductase [Flavobacteriaceae bacterium]|nr:nitroreductase [Flavobacteriaceae bacterium]
MKLEDIIRQRRSVSPLMFANREISKDIILKLLESANWAPTHRKTEPWRFKILTGESKTNLGNFLAEKYKETAAKFSNFKFNSIKNKVDKSPVIIAICMQRDLNESVPEWEEIAATAMAVQNLWLTATNLGLNGYWSSPSLINYMDGYFNFSEGERCLGFFYLGYMEGPKPERTPNPIEEKVEWLE